LYNITRVGLLEAVTAHSQKLSLLHAALETLATLEKTEESKNQTGKKIHFQSPDHLSVNIDQQ